MIYAEGSIHESFYREERGGQLSWRGMACREKLIERQISRQRVSKIIPIPSIRYNSMIYAQQ